MELFCTVDFAVTVDHRVKINENENCDNYEDPVRELRKLWKMMMVVIPIVICVFKKGLEKGMKELEIGE